MIETLIETSSVALPGRMRLDYVEQGDPTGIPLVLLHGATDSWRSYAEVLPLLPASLHAFAVTQRGHGDAELTDPIDSTFAREFQQSTLARPMSPALFETAVRESLKVPARVWRAAFAGFMADDVAGDLAKIEAPTLILWGDQDAFFPRGDQETLATLIPDARLVVYPGAGHAFHWEDPKRYVADLTAFAEQIGG